MFTFTSPLLGTISLISSGGSVENENKINFYVPRISQRPISGSSGYDDKGTFFLSSASKDCDQPRRCLCVCKPPFKHGNSSVKLKLKTKTNYNCIT